MDEGETQQERIGKFDRPGCIKPGSWVDREREVRVSERPPAGSALQAVMEWAIQRPTRFWHWFWLRDLEELMAAAKAADGRDDPVVEAARGVITPPSEKGSRKLIADSLDRLRAALAARAALDPAEYEAAIPPGEAPDEEVPLLTAAEKLAEIAKKHGGKITVP